MLIAASLIPAMISCEEEDIRTYQAPKSDPYIEPQPGPRGGSSRSAPAAIKWVTPPGWSQSSSSSNISFAVFEAGGEAGDARITVTKLGSDGGGVLANINRWRRQVGLGPVDSVEAQPVTPLHVDGNPVSLIDLTAPEGADTGLDRMLVVMLPRPQDGLTWYLKMIGPVQTLEEQKPAFVSFVESVTFQSHEHANANPASEDAPEKTDTGDEKHNEGDPGGDGGAAGE